MRIILRQALNLLKANTSNKKTYNIIINFIYN